MYEGMFGMKEKPPFLVVVVSLLCCLFFNQFFSTKFLSSQISEFI